MSPRGLTDMEVGELVLRYRRDRFADRSELRGGEAAYPGEPPPQGAVVQSSLIDVTRDLGVYADIGGKSDSTRTRSGKYLVGSVPRRPPPTQRVGETRQRHRGGIGTPEVICCRAARSSVPPPGQGLVHAGSSLARSAIRSSPRINARARTR